jgi:hypothetical protein
MNDVSGARRTLPVASAEEAAGVLRRFVEAVESGQLLARAPQDVAIVRHLHEALAALEVAGDGPGGVSTRSP